MAYIYKIINNINQKIYIGKTTKTIEERFRAHLNNARKKINRYLYDAMNHYGYDNFSIDQVEECQDSIVDEREKYWIAFYQSNNSNYGYNMTEGGEGGNTWAKNPHKEETAEKIRQANLGSKRTEEQKQKMSQAQKGVYYIPIDKDEFLKDIESGMSIDDMSQKYNASKETLYYRCRAYFNTSIGKLRKIQPIKKPRIYSEETKQYLAAIHRESFSGENNPLYKPLTDTMTLEEMLKNDIGADEIAKYFNMSKPTLYKKIKEIYNMSMKEARKYVKSKNK